MQTEDKKQPTMHTREMMAVQIETPPKDIVYEMWWKAKRAPGRLIQLPIEARGSEKMFLTVETNADGERPMWTLYAGEGATARVLWNYVLSDIEMIQEIVALSVSSGSSSAVFENCAPVDTGSSRAALEPPLQTMSQQAAFQQTESQQAMSQQAASQQTESQQATSQQSAFQQAASQQTESQQSASQQAAPQWEDSFAEVAAYDFSSPGSASTPVREAPKALEKPVVAPPSERKREESKTLTAPQQKASQSSAPNIMLGNILVDSGLMPKPLLEASLKVQDMVRKSELTPDQATDILRKMHTRGVGLQEVLAEMKRKSNEKPPEDAVDFLREAGVVSEQDVIKAKHVLLQLRKAGLESDKGSEIAQGMLELLRLAGFISDEDIRRATAASSSRSTEICKTLLTGGTIDALSFEVASRFVKYMRVGRFKQEQAVIALHYSQRCRTGFEETVHSMGWQVQIES